MDAVVRTLDIEGGDTGFPVQLVREGESKRIVVRAINEGGFSCTDTDLVGLLISLNEIAPGSVNLAAITEAISVLPVEKCAG